MNTMNLSGCVPWPMAEDIRALVRGAVHVNGRKNADLGR